MKQVYYQPYKGKRSIAGYYGKPPKGQYKDDVIAIKLSCGEDIYMTPDEAADIIRAISAGLHHALVKHPKLNKMALDKQ